MLQNTESSSFVPETAPLSQGPAERPEDRRLHPRLETQIKTNIKAQNVSKSNREYLEGVISNVSLGGVFIETTHPYPKGTVLTLEFKLQDGDDTTLRARALVRHSKRFFGERGMGVEFIEFEHLGKTKLEGWLEKLRSARVTSTDV